MRRGFRKRGFYHTGAAAEGYLWWFLLGIAAVLGMAFVLSLSWGKLESAVKSVVRKFVLEAPLIDAAEDARGESEWMSAQESQGGSGRVPARESLGVSAQAASGQALGRAFSFFQASAMEFNSRALGFLEGRPRSGKRLERESGLRASGAGNESAAGSGFAGESESAEFLIVLDPGHGGVDEGCVRDGVREKEINLAIALVLRDLLQEMGYQVLMTREEDAALSLEERITLANDRGADIFVSIHQNAFEEENVCGMETWFDGEGDLAEDSRRLARLIHGQALEECGAADRGIRPDSAYYVTRHTEMPSCLIETGFLSAEEEREALCSPEYQERLARGIARGIELYFHPKTMYLTFDDGPSKENTVKVLDLLKEAGVHATFFVIGESVRKYPEIAKRIVEEGHTIGIHCNVHIYQQIYASVESYVEDFQEALDAVYEVTGVEPWLFRFPGGSINSYNKEVYKDIIAEMTDRGYVYFDWNASLEDAARGTTPELLLSNAKETARGRRKVVMLAHDIVDNTVQCLPRLLDLFPEYRMEPLTEEVTPIQF